MPESTAHEAHSSAPVGSGPVLVTGARGKTGRRIHERLSAAGWVMVSTS